MASFVFKYEAMKKYRLHRLLVAKKELAQIEENLHGLKRARNEALSERGEAIEASVKVQARVADFIWYPQLVEIQGKRIALLDEQIKHIEVEFERHARWVAQLGQELKIVEKLEERQRAAFEFEEKMREKRRADRWVAERWQRVAK